MGDTERSPESWEAKGKRRNIKTTTVKENLSKATGKAKKPLTEAGGTGLG